MPKLTKVKTEKESPSDLYTTNQITNATTSSGDAGVSSGSSDASSSGSSSPTSDPSNIYLDEIQKAASEKNYKTLTKSDIAAYNLKMDTQKYLNNALASEGVSSQGYGTSAHVGVENNASQLYAQNQETFNDAEATAATEAQTRADTAATEDDNQLATYLQYSDGSDDQINTYMNNYGYTKQSDGTWKDKNGNAPSKYILSAITSAQNGTSTTSGDTVTVEKQSTYDSTITDTAKAGVSFVNAYKSNYSGVSSSGYTTADIKDVTVGNKDNSGSTDKLSNIVGNEVQMMINAVNKGSVADGTLFRLQRGGGYNEAYLVMYVNGKFYLCSNDDREEDGNQVQTRYNEYTGPKVYYKSSSEVK